MGYTQELERNFSKWSLLGICFALTNSCVPLLPRYRLS